jgi:putative ABC transport system permease protein
MGKIMIRVSANNTKQVIDGINQSWRSFYPNIPFEYHFLDQEFKDLYVSEQRIGAILNMFTLVTIIISCLGLFGLAVYTVKQRVKEIGIRKILGASVSSVLTLVASDF